MNYMEVVAELEGLDYRRAIKLTTVILSEAT